METVALIIDIFKCALCIAYFFVIGKFYVQYKRKLKRNDTRYYDRLLHIQMKYNKANTISLC